VIIQYYILDKMLKSKLLSESEKSKCPNSDTFPLKKKYANWQFLIENRSFHHGVYQSNISALLFASELSTK